MIDFATLLQPVSNRILAGLQVAVRSTLADLHKRQEIVMQRTSEIEKEAHGLVEDIEDADALLLALSLEQERRDA